MNTALAAAANVHASRLNDMIGEGLHFHRLEDGRKVYVKLIHVVSVEEAGDHAKIMMTTGFYIEVAETYEYVIQLMREVWE